MSASLGLAHWGRVVSRSWGSGTDDPAERGAIDQVPGQCPQRGGKPPSAALKTPAPSSGAIRLSMTPQRSPPRPCPSGRGSRHIVGGTARSPGADTLVTDCAQPRGISPCRPTMCRLRGPEGMVWAGLLWGVMESLIAPLLVLGSSVRTGRFRPRCGHWPGTWSMAPRSAGSSVPEPPGPGDHTTQ